MSYDATVAARIRSLLSERADVTERKMFGGLAFLVGGNLAVAASGQGGILVRCDATATDDHIVDGAEPMIMRAQADERMASGQRRGRGRRSRSGALGADRHGNRRQPAGQVAPPAETRFRRDREGLPSG